MCQLPQLRELNLNDNNLITLPDGIGNLQCLKRLNLLNNPRFCRLPPSCENLHLEWLEMWGIDFFHIEPATAVILEKIQAKGTSILPENWKTDFDEFHAVWDHPKRKKAFFAFLRRYVQNQTTQAEEQEWKFNSSMPVYEEIASWLEPLCRQAKGQRAKDMLTSIEGARVRKNMPVPNSEHQILL